MNSIKIFGMDVDGTLTNGYLYIGPNSEIMKVFNAKDGLGISKLHKNHIVPVIITKRKSDIVSYRAKELNITEVYQNIIDKTTILKQITEKYNCSFENVAYIGDDENDLDCMQKCGIKGCPADAVEAIKGISDFICVNNGGEGAVREFVDYVLSFVSDVL
jgi:3-deoxy-D-manno-octulosonate 8-phosphate phosphatase (KDO 8-P phosphatase)